MITRKLESMDKTAAKNIWRECFPEDSDCYIDWYFENVFAAERSIGLFEGELLSVIQFAPYKLNIRGEELDANFIVGASTKISAQKRGLMAKLLNLAFEYLHSKNQPVSTLYPFDYDFYRKFGYEVCSERLNCVVETGDCAKLNTLKTNLSACEMLRIYRAMMARFDVFMIRSESDCARRLDGWLIDRNWVYCVDGAYALASVQNGVVFCEELIYESPAALHELLRALPAREVRCGLPCCDEKLLPQGSVVEKTPFAMMRIIDAAWAVKMAGLDAYKFKIIDRQCVWNDGMCVEPATGVAASARKQIDINELAMELCGIREGSDSGKTASYVVDMY